MSRFAVKAILLDINGTVFDPHIAAEGVFKDLGIDPSEFDLWFAEVLRDATSAQLAGVFAPFRDFGGYHLARRSRNKLITPESAASKLSASWMQAQPFTDVRLGLTKLELEGSIKIACLTNGSRQIAAEVLSRAGIDTNKASLFDITEVKAWKPSREAYTFACNALMLAPHEVMMVASHPWDCHGAMQAGLQAAYVQRDANHPYPSFFSEQPQIVVKDFNELADTLLCG